MLEVLKSNLLIENGVVKPNDALFLKLESYNIGEHRLGHSLRVAELCYEVAVSNKLEDPLTFYIAGMLHDIGKHVSDEDSVKMIEKEFKEVPNVGKFAYHAFVGAIIAKYDFGVESKEVLQSIMDHCTGNKDLSSYGMILYACDKIDPGRGYDSKYMIDAMLKDYKEGFKLVLHENLIFLSSKYGKTPSEFIQTTNELSQKCFAQYLDLSEFI